MGEGVVKATRENFLDCVHTINNIMVMVELSVLHIVYGILCGVYNAVCTVHIRHRY